MPASPPKPSESFECLMIDHEGSKLLEPCFCWARGRGRV